MRQEELLEARAQAWLGDLNGRVVVRAVLHKGMYPSGMVWHRMLHLRLMEVQTLQEQIKHGVDLGVVKPSGGDSILDKQSWSAALKCGLGISVLDILT